MHTTASHVHKTVENITAHITHIYVEHGDGDCDNEGAGELDNRAGDVSGWRFLGRPRLLSSDEL